MEGESESAAAGGSGDAGRDSSTGDNHNQKQRDNIGEAGPPGEHGETAGEEGNNEGATTEVEINVSVDFDISTHTTGEYWNNIPPGTYIPGTKIPRTDTDYGINWYVHTLFDCVLTEKQNQRGGYGATLPYCFHE